MAIILAGPRAKKSALKAGKKTLTSDPRETTVPKVRKTFSFHDFFEICKALSNGYENVGTCGTMKHAKIIINNTVENMVIS